VNVLLVPAHPGFPGQIPQSRKTVVCVCVCVSAHPGCPGQNSESRKTVVCRLCVCVCMFYLFEEGRKMVVYVCVCLLYG